MTRAKALTVLSLTLPILSACGLIDGSGIASRPDAASQEAAASAAAASVAPVAAPATRPSSASGLQGGGQTVAQLDRTTAAEKAAASAPATGGGKLGTTIASLGDATESGFWVKTPLVSAPAKGRVVNPANGKAANVDLQPLGGGASGSQLSLAAMQALGVSLTDLPEIEVWQN